MSVHPGQAAFPGGRVEDADTDRWHTALREAEEEVAILPSQVQPLGMLDDFITITGYHVTPCVGLLQPELSVQADTLEVDRVFRIPLHHLLQTRNRRTMRIGALHQDRRVYFYRHQAEIVWGATAAMLTNLLQLFASEQTTP